MAAIALLRAAAGVARGEAAAAVDAATEKARGAKKIVRFCSVRSAEQILTSANKQIKKQTTTLHEMEILRFGVVVGGTVSYDHVQRIQRRIGEAGVNR